MANRRSIRNRAVDFWTRRIRKGQPTPPTPLGDQRSLASQQEYAGGTVPITYAPTKTSNPADPRTSAAGYDADTKTLRVEWGDGGAAYNYYDVSPREWRNFQRAPSPGKYINRVLNNHKYGRAE